jgi:NADPH:quinone reductase-like Zn-dependent oxidoreductase
MGGAWFVEGGFGLDRLVWRPRTLPPVAPGSVRVAIRAVSLNYRDLLMVGGQYDPRQALPLVPGSDAAGEVAEVGAGVRRWRVGDAVIPSFATGWQSGTPERWMQRSTLGGPLDGTFATHVDVPEAALVAKPGHLTFEEAATLPCAGVTAWRALVSEGRLTSGETVVTQGTGGVSMFAVQIAKMHGARVGATTSSDAKASLLRAWGAEAVWRRDRTPAWGKEALAWTEARGADHVLDLGGASTISESLRAVRPAGRVSLIGILGGVEAPLPLTRIFMQGITVQGILVGSTADLAALCRAYAAHPTCRPVLDRVEALADLPRALAAMARGEHAGKIVLRVAG